MASEVCGLRVSWMFLGVSSEEGQGVLGFSDEHGHHGAVVLALVAFRRALEAGGTKFKDFP